jgi:hypothetical protein
MTASNHTHATSGEIRETYQEYTVGNRRVATISDPENAAAWIQSTETAEVLQ